MATYVLSNLVDSAGRGRHDAHCSSIAKCAALGMQSRIADEEADQDARIRCDETAVHAEPLTIHDVAVRRACKIIAPTRRYCVSWSIGG